MSEPTVFVIYRGSSDGLEFDDPDFGPIKMARDGMPVEIPDRLYREWKDRRDIELEHVNKRDVDEVADNVRRAEIENLNAATSDGVPEAGTPVAEESEDKQGGSD